MAHKRSTAPEWKYMEWDDIEKMHKCMFCKASMQDNLTRVRGHLLGNSNQVSSCLKIDKGSKQNLLQLFESKIENTSRKQKAHIEIGNIQCRPPISLQGKSNQTLKALWDNKSKENVDRAVRRYFYGDAVPFNHARSPYFHGMVSAISEYGKGYNSPSYESLRTSGLKKEKAELMNELKPIIDSWSKTGCTIVSDGWSDRRRRTLVNTLASCPRGAVFLKAVDASNETKTSEYISTILEEAILHVGVENVVHIVSDNASNCVDAGKILMDKYPTIFWSPCVAHVLDLLLEDFGKLPWVSTVVEQGKMIAKFITNHQFTLSKYRKECKRDLLMPGDTRFATRFLTLQREVEEKEAIRSVVVGRDWANCKLSSIQKNKETAAIILGEQFWEGAIKANTMFEPIVKVLRMVDGDIPCMGDIIEAMDTAKETIKQSFGGDSHKSEWNYLWAIIDERWYMMHTPLHSAACYFNPRLFGIKHESDEETMDGLYQCMDRMYPDPIIRSKLDVQKNAYRDEIGILFSRKIARDNRTNPDMTPVQWWQSYGGSTPELQRLAIRVLSQVCTASSCERNWSTFELIHSKRRNRLGTQQLSDLVFVHSNMRVISSNIARNYSSTSNPTSFNSNENANYDVEYFADVSSDEEDISDGEYLASDSCEA